MSSGGCVGWRCCRCLLHQSQANLRFREFRPWSLIRASSTMTTGTNKNGSSSSPEVNIAEVSKVQLLLNNNSTDGWDKCWEEGVTPWDLGAPTPILLQLCLPKGRILVPGCGSGYDVVAMAGPERYVIGLDISANALKKAKQLHSSSSKADYIEFLMEDFFTWHPSEQFDLIFDYTFFCAIEPSMRAAWASRMQDLLKPGGELITLMFPISDHVGGPPYKVSLADYEEVLHPVGFEASFVEDNELAVGQRKGKEKLARWKRIEKHSQL